MTWNYRILAHKYDTEWYFQVHEVYYNEQGTPVSYALAGTTIGSESLKGINQVLNQLHESLNSPILSTEDFPKEWNVAD
jgi:hypothetical protein